MKAEFYLTRKLIDAARTRTDPEREQEVDPGKYILERISNPFGHAEDWLVLEGTTLGMAESAWLQYDDPRYRYYYRYEVTIEDPFIEAVSAHTDLSREKVLRTIMPRLIKEDSCEVFLPQSCVVDFIETLRGDEEGETYYETEPMVWIRVTRPPTMPAQANGFHAGTVESLLKRTA